jgi:hypothetical protein
MKPIVFALPITLCLGTTFAQAQKETGALNLTAKSASVSESGTPVRINLLRWSTDEERNLLIASMNPAAPVAAERGGRGGRGGRGARGGAAQADPDDIAPDPALADVPGGGRGARGRGRGGAAAGPPNPIASLTAAIDRLPTVGYVWTNEVTGYSIKYAYHAPLPDGGERIILGTDRRLGGSSPSWKLLAVSTPTDYEFTLVEIRLDPKGSGEGKASLTTKVMVDNEAKTIALENYSAASPILQSVKR